MLRGTGTLSPRETLESVSSFQTLPRFRDEDFAQGRSTRAGGMFCTPMRNNLSMVHGNIVCHCSRMQRSTGRCESYPHRGIRKSVESSVIELAANMRESYLALPPLCYTSLHYKFCLVAGVYRVPSMVACPWRWPLRHTAHCCAQRASTRMATQEEVRNPSPEMGLRSSVGLFSAP